MNMSFYVGALGAGNCTKKLSVIANNLANVNTSGYKPKSTAFTELISYNLNDSPAAVTELRAGAGMQVQSTDTSFDMNGFIRTGGQYDYAIAHPHAFFMIQDPVSGDVVYTRDGHFHRGEREDGFYLTTASGKLVLDQNQQPIRLDVADPDELRAEMEEGYEREYEEYNNEADGEQPEVGLYIFAYPSHLMNIGGNEFVPAKSSVKPVRLETGALVKHSLETSGTDMAKELTRLIECQRAFSYAIKMVTTSDEIEGIINTLRG